MQYLILFIIITINSIIFAIKLKIKTEQAIPISIISIILIVYFTGILGNLLIGIYLIILITNLAIIYLIYYLAKSIENRKGFIKKYITPGIIIYALIYIVFIIINKNRIFTNYDEFNHWGLIIKDIYMNNNFAFTRESITLFNEYPPFTAVFEYILLKFSNSYSEDTIIIANNILSVSMLMPILKKVNWDKSIKWSFIITPIIIGIPLIIYKNFYFNILVDGLIGILIAYILYQWFTNDNNKTYRNISVCLGIIAVTLIKSSGIGISILILLILLGECLKRKKEKENVKKDVITIIIILIISIIILGTWLININRYNQTKNWNMQNINLNNIIELIKGNEPEGKAGFSKIFFQSIFSNETITQRNLTIFTMTLLIIALNIYVYTKLNKNLKSKYKYYSITLYIFELIYLVYMLFVYLFLFNPEETMALSSFERYFGTIGLAFIMYHILIWLEYKKDINIKSTIIVLCILITFLPMETITAKIINGKQSKIVEITDRKTYIGILNYKNIFKSNDKIYYIDTTPYSSKYSLQIMKYLIMPTKIDNEILISDNSENILEILKEKGYTYLYIQKTSETLKSKMEGKIIDKLEDKTLYKIIFEENRLEKVEI